MSKVILKGYIVVPEDELTIVIQELETHKKLTLQEPGCLLFSVTQSLDEPTKFDVYEEFANRAAFESHQLRVRESKWGAVTQNVERFYEIITRKAAQ